ncbi:MAG: hypothetical protein ACK55I_39185, partial [bacterium]
SSVHGRRRRTHVPRTAVRTRRPARLAVLTRTTRHGDSVVAAARRTHEASAAVAARRPAGSTVPTRSAYRVHRRR